jgi:hypothetical protein
MTCVVRGLRPRRALKLASRSLPWAIADLPALGSGRLSLRAHWQAASGRPPGALTGWATGQTLNATCIMLEGCALSPAFDSRARRDSGPAYGGFARPPLPVAVALAGLPGALASLKSSSWEAQYDHETPRTNSDRG